jgi:hypothetical protein
MSRNKESRLAVNSSGVLGDDRDLPTPIPRQQAFECVTWPDLSKESAAGNHFGYAFSQNNLASSRAIICRGVF